MAFLYETNKWNYDIQGFIGYQREALVTGTGWTGNLKSAGFRGEATYFYEKEGDIEHQIVATIDLDYTFSSTVYLHGSYLYNSIGINTATGDYQGFYLNRDLGARTLSPSRHTLFGEIAYQFSPPVRGSLYSMVNPKDASFFIGPMLTWSVVENFDILLNAQIFSNKPNTAFGGYGQSYYLRFKYSF
jgi:hypothetical protein